MDQFGLPERRLTSHDGTRISYWVSRPPPQHDRGLTLMLANGIGISRLVWQDLIAAFRTRYTLVFWDYRAFYRSEKPRDLARFSLADHAGDLARILEQEKLEQVVLIGWSMGVQVSLESCRAVPERIAGLVLLNGTSGRTYDTAFGLPGLAYWVPPLTSYLSQRHVSSLRLILPRIFRKEMVHLMKASGTVAPCVDTLLLARILEEYATLDFGVYFHLLNALAHHTPTHLEQVRVPALVLVGSRDHFTPPVAGKKLRDRLPMAELERIEGGTHYMLMEYSAKIRSRIERFLEDRIHPRVPVPARTPVPLREGPQVLELRLADRTRPHAANGSSAQSQPEAATPGSSSRGSASAGRARARLRRTLHALERADLRRTLRHLLRRGAPT